MASVVPIITDELPLPIRPILAHCEQFNSHKHISSRSTRGVVLYRNTHKPRKGDHSPDQNCFRPVYRNEGPFCFCWYLIVIILCRDTVVVNFYIESTSRYCRGVSEVHSTVPKSSIVSQYVYFGICRSRIVCDGDSSRVIGS